MMWNLPQHSYEEIREVVLDVMSKSATNGVNQFTEVLSEAGRTFARQQNPSVHSSQLDARLHPQDANTVLEVIWDLFRQGIITLGLNTSNPGWPWMRLSRFGQQAIQDQQPYRFHDSAGFLKVIRAEVPDISDEAVKYLEEAVACFYADCLLASVVMLGAAAEFEFLRLIDVAANSATHGARFLPATKPPVIRGKITKFHDLLKPISHTLPKAAIEDLDVNLTAIQSAIRIARNEFGHPTGTKPPTREQVYMWLVLFVPFARQLMRLRQELK